VARRWPAALIALTVAGTAASCGGEETGATITLPETTTILATTAATTAVVTSTTTTTTPTTTAPDDRHPAWPVSWAALWPADGSSATVRAATNEGTVDAGIGIDYGLEWDTGTWDRIWLGSTEEGLLGVSFYLQRPEPWVIVLWGAATHSPFLSMTERFDPPLTFDLRGLAEGPLSMETTVIISDADGVVDEGPYAFTIALIGIEDVEVAAGQFTGTAHLHLTAEEPGGYVAETDVWIDAGQALVRLSPAHIWESLELATLWSE
jgi:hypothetical protein